MMAGVYIAEVHQQYTCAGMLIGGRKDYDIYPSGYLMTHSIMSDNKKFMWFKQLTD